MVCMNEYLEHCCCAGYHRGLPPTAIQRGMEIRWYLQKVAQRLFVLLQSPNIPLYSMHAPLCDRPAKSDHGSAREGRARRKSKRLDEQGIEPWTSCKPDV
jgi:hypothetical protein